MIQSVKKFEVNNVVVSYKMTLTNGEIWSVPIDEANTDYQNILQWVEDGNTIEEAD
tara:strand:- start:41 stop:208 length:168 start_codon:yes stop_codon:yes gene_type:complete